MIEYEQTRSGRRLGAARAPLSVAGGGFPTRLRIVLACACLGAAAGIAIRAIHAIVTGG